MCTNKKLTIAIPTRNRCESLRKTVTEVCKRVLEEDAINDVQILIVDDCTTIDKTESYIIALMKEYNFLSYYCCEEDLSFDSKLLKCIELSASKFVWTINDHSSLLPGLINKILNCLKEDYCFIFAPIEGGLSDAVKVHSISKFGIGFINTVLNTNIFNRECILPYYYKSLLDYDNSWLVYQLANLELLYENPSKEVLLLQFECTEYGKYMDIERKKNTWSANWENYVRTGYNGAKLLDQIKKKYNIKDSFYKEIFDRRDWGLGACLAYMNLRKNEKQIEKERADVITRHPTYNGIEKTIIKAALCIDNKSLILYKALLYAYIIYLSPTFYARIFKSILRKINISQ